MVRYGRWLPLSFSRGFTLPELIVVMIVLGILAAYAAPRFSGRHGFEGRGFSDQLQVLLQDARRTAIAQRRLVCVTTVGNSVSVTKAAFFGGACNTALAHPNAAGAYILAIPDGVVLAPMQLNFDPLGRLSPTTSVTVNVSGQEGGFTLTVEGESGYVHR